MRKNYLFLTLIILSVMLARSIYADEVSKRKLTEELLSAMKVQSMADKVFEQVKMIQMSQIRSIISSEKDFAGAQALQEKITALIKKEFEWEVLKSEYIAIYEGAFTEEEIKGLLDFHKSSLGQKLIEKNPEIMTKSMGIGQKRMISIMPEVQKIIKEWITEQKSFIKENEKKEEPAK